MITRIIRVGVLTILILRKILLIIKVIEIIRQDLTLLSYITTTSSSSSSGVTFLRPSTLVGYCQPLRLHPRSYLYIPLWASYLPPPLSVKDQLCDQSRAG
jgi:hypothetical protein